jgi:hypothetical protein
MPRSEAAVGDRRSDFALICRSIVLGTDVDDSTSAPASAPASAAAPRAVALNLLGAIGGGGPPARKRPRHYQRHRPHGRDDPSELLPDDDPWLVNARRLQDSIAQMSRVLRGQAAAYMDPYRCWPGRGGSGSGRGDPAVTMSDADRNGLDAAVASFSVSTGNQIEALRQALSEAASAAGLSGAPSDEAAAHRLGIVACLTASLQGDVVESLHEMREVRSRPSLGWARDPLRCRIGSGSGSGPGPGSGAAPPAAEDDGLGLGSGLGSNPVDEGGIGTADGGGIGGILREIRAAAEAAEDGEAGGPANVRAEREGEFDSNNGRGGEEALLAALAAPPPSFPGVGGPPPGSIAVAGAADEDGEGPRSVQRAPPPPVPSRSSAAPPPTAYLETAEEQEAYIEDLQREAALLTAARHGDLEGVQRVETQTVQIATLLRQMGDLVSEQQSDVAAIHEQAEKSRANVQAGQDNLVDAGERKKKSGHYMATFIFAMGVLLLFLNWITP